MTRRALLIAASRVPGQDRLPGARADLEHWTEYLSSPYGGAWDPEREICAIDNTDPDELAEALQWAATGDFAFVTFSGHGYAERTTGRTILVMGEDWLVPVASIKPRTTRRVIVVDACRTLMPLLEQVEKGFGDLMEKIGAAAPDPRLCRAIFDRLVERAEQGETVMYSCSPDQEAGDPGTGGYFTTALIETALAWGRAVPGNAEWLPVPGAFDLAKDALEADGAIQVPRIVNGRRQNQFPFSVVPRTRNFPFTVVGR